MNINANYQINGNNDDENKSPIVSVIVPCYNAEAYLERCVDSILKQTLTDFELLLIDDCSTDQTYSLMEKLAERDRRIRLFRTTENSGPGPTRNVGLDAARGEYVTFADSDDILNENFLKTLYQTAKLQSADVVSCASMKVTSSKSADVKKCKRIWPLHDVSGGWNTVRLFQKNGQISLVVWDTLFSLKLIKSCNIEFNPTVFEDLFFKYRALYHCYHFVCIADVLYYCNYRSDSLSSVNNNNRKYSYIEAIFLFLDYVQEWMNTLKKTSVVPPEEEQATYRYFFQLSLQWVWETEKRLGKEFKKLFDEYANKYFAEKSIYMATFYDLYTRQSRWGDEMEAKQKELTSLISFYEKVDPILGEFHRRQQLSNFILLYPSSEWSNITEADWYKEYWRMVANKERNSVLQQKAAEFREKILSTLQMQDDPVTKQKTVFALLLYDDIKSVINYIEPEIWPEKLREDFILCYKYSELSEVSQS